MVLLTGYMGLIACAGLQEAFFPAPPTPPVYFVDMPAPLLALNAVLVLVLPLGTLFFLGAGLLGLRATVPEVRSRLTWRVGSIVLGPLRLAGLVILAMIIVFLVWMAFAIAVFLGGGAASDLSTGASLFVDATMEALIVAFGWCLMVFPAKTIGPWTTRWESRSVSAAIWVISAAALGAAAAQYIVAGIGTAKVLADPAATPPAVPMWVQGFTGLAAVGGLLVLTWIARRIVHRMRRAPTRAVPLPV